MSISTSPLSYGDCYAMMDAALADPLGSRIAVRKPTHDASVAEATFLRMRMHQARKLHRDQNAAVYTVDHPMHGCSMYDKLTMRIKTINGTVYLYLEQQALNIDVGEPLSQVDEVEYEPVPELQHTETLSIAGPKAEISIPIKRRI